MVHRKQPTPTPPGQLRSNLIRSLEARSGYPHNQSEEGKRWWKGLTRQTSDLKPERGVAGPDSDISVISEELLECSEETAVTKVRPCFYQDRKGIDLGGEALRDHRESDRSPVMRISSQLQQPFCVEVEKGWEARQKTISHLCPGLYRFQFSANLVLARNSDSWYHAYQGYVHLILSLQR